MMAVEVAFLKPMVNRRRSLCDDSHTLFALGVGGGAECLALPDRLAESVDGTRGFGARAHHEVAVDRQAYRGGLRGVEVEVD